jgi:hypothetical protein
MSISAITEVKAPTPGKVFSHINWLNCPRSNRRKFRQIKH